MSGQVVKVEDKTRSRRDVTVTTPDFGLTRVTLMPGVLGSDDGIEVLRRASDPRAVAYTELRRSAKDRRKLPATGTPGTGDDEFEGAAQ